MAKSWREHIAAGGTLPPMRGADGEEEPLFPAVPEDRGELSDDELQALLDEYAEIADRVLAEVQAGDPTHLADLEAAAPIAVELQELQAARATAAEEAATQAAELAEQIRGAQTDEPAAEEPPAEETGSTEGQQESDEPAADEETADEPEAVVAAGRPRPAAPAPATARRRPRQASQERMALVAAGEGLDTPIGRPFASMEAFYEQAARRLDQIKGSAGNYPLARIRSEAPEELTLRAGDREGNRRKIDARLAPRALAASGGLCAPATPYYDLLTYSSAERPLRAALPSFNATRGGIIFKASVTLSSITTAVGRITASQDAAGGTSATKTFQRVTCPASTEVDIAAVYEYVEFGELGRRTYPEQVEQFTQLVDAAWARKAEGALLDGIKAASTSVTAVSPGDGTNSLGLVAAYVGQVAAVVAAFRQRHRTAWDMRFRCVVQEWLLLAMMVDEDRRSFGAAASEAELRGKLEKYGINLVVVKDSAAGDAQTMAGPASAVATHTTEPLPFPPNHVSYIFPEGSFLFLDGGELNIGMLRDSALATTNDVRFFQETFENVAFVGVESIRLVSPVCVNGARSGSIVPLCNTFLV